MLGSGTELDPYQVATAEDLDAVRDNLTAYYIQTADIDLSGYSNWMPIGGTQSSFEGCFIGSYDGNNHSVLNLTINRPDDDYIGLFGNMYDGEFYGEIKNLNIDDAHIKGYSGVGILAGMSNAKITNVHTSGLVECYGHIAGGVVGSQSDFADNSAGHLSDIIECSSTADVIGLFYSTEYPYAGHWLGGLFGRLSSFVIDRCFATGNVSAVTTDGKAYYIGGFAGQLWSGWTGEWCTISNCYSSGSVTSSYRSGGFIGTSNRVNYINCYTCGQVNADGANVGAFVGYVVVGLPNINVESCYYDSEVTGQSDLYATGKPTEEMKTQSTFVDWDFTDIWEINGGYPTLKWARTVFPLQTGKDYMLVQEHKVGEYTGSMTYAGKNWDYVSTLEGFAKTLHETAGVSVTYEYGGPVVSYNGQPCVYLCSGITDPTASGGFGSYLPDTKRTVTSLADREAYVNFYYMLPALAQVEKPIWVGKVITWKDVPNASYYEVKLYLDGACLDTQLVSPGVQRLDYTYFIETFMPAGSYSCTVQAMASEIINKVIYWTDNPEALSYNVYLINGTGAVVFEDSVALGVQTYDFSSIIPGLPTGASYFGFAVPVMPET